MGYWWAPSSEAIAFQRTDERHIAPFTITHGGDEPADSTSCEVHRYPFAGGSNPIVRLGVVSVASALEGSRAVATMSAVPAPPPVTWVDLSGGRDATGSIGGSGGYLARVQWLNPVTLCAQLLNRRQDTLDVVLFALPQVPADAGSLASESDRLPSSLVPGVLLLRDTADDPERGWLNVHDCLTFLPADLSKARPCEIGASEQSGSTYFLWASERPSGFSHLQLYQFEWDMRGPVYNGLPPSSRRLPPPLSAGRAAPDAAVVGDRPVALARFVGAVTAGTGWLVESVAAILPVLPGTTAKGAGTATESPVSGWVLWHGTADHCLERHLYASPLVPPTEVVDRQPADTRPATLRLTSGAGTHTCVVSPAGGAPWFLDTLGSLHSVPSLAAYAFSAAAVSDDEAALCAPTAASPGVPVNDPLAVLGGGLVRFDDGVDLRGASVYLSDCPSEGFSRRFRTPHDESSVHLRLPRISRELVGLCHGTLPTGGSSTPESYIIGEQRLRAWRAAAAGSDTADVSVTRMGLDAFLQAGGRLDAPTGSPVASSPPTVEAASSASAPLIVRVPVPAAAPLSASGETDDMYGAVYLPPTGTPPFACVLHVYGGPHVQRVRHDWSLTADARSRALARAGFLVAAFDNRGSSRRGAAWERVVSRRLGGPEVEDQAAAVRWLTAVGLVDPTRVGAVGWSYGGYMALRLLQHRHDGGAPVVAAGVAGAPVTDWAGYDTACEFPWGRSFQSPALLEFVCSHHLLQTRSATWASPGQLLAARAVASTGTLLTSQLMRTRRPAF